nr:MAG TPA: hypothetical protein [Caudoviricetes sp.]
MCNILLIIVLLFSASRANMCTTKGKKSMEE